MKPRDYLFNHKPLTKRKRWLPSAVGGSVTHGGIAIDGSGGNITTVESFFHPADI